MAEKSIPVADLPIDASATPEAFEAWLAKNHVQMQPQTPAPRSRARWLAATALVLLGCGPSDQDVGVATLTSLALIVPVGAVLNLGLHRLWRNSRELLEASWIEAAAAWLVTLAVATALNVFVVPCEGDLLLIGLWLIGTTYLTYFSLGIGLALALSQRWAFRGVYCVPAAFIAALALPLALEVHLGSGIVESIMFVLVWSGGLGAVGGTLFLVLLGVSIHVFVRGRRRPPDHVPPLSF